MTRISVAIGTEPKQRAACEVLKASILRRTEAKVEFFESWTQKGGWNRELEREGRVGRGTRFALWRWVMASVVGDGVAIYLDADQLVLADIEDLATVLEGTGKPIAMVTSPEGTFGGKPVGSERQTSVLVADLDARLWEPRSLIARVRDGKMSYKDLQLARWVPEESIVDLDPAWNHLNVLKHNTRLVHFTHVASQPYRNPGHELSSVFHDEVKAAIAEGFLDPSLINSEADKGNLHRNYRIPRR